MTMMDAIKKANAMLINYGLMYSSILLKFAFFKSPKKHSVVMVASFGKYRTLL